MLPDDLCPAGVPQSKIASTTSPHSPPIVLASVWECESPEQARAMLAGEQQGYVYQRDGHPNADALAEKCRLLHGAQQAAITSCGMSALSAAVLSQLSSGDHLIASNQLYGRSLELLVRETARLGIASSMVDTCDLDAVAAAMRPETKLVVVETISNPLLRVANIASLGELANSRGAKLLVDNTFASPILCRPLEHGADLVLESISKIMSGHSDVMLGMLAGGDELWQRVRPVLSIWGLASSPMDCWLALRGLSTLHLRVERACRNAQAVAEFLAARDEVLDVVYPGLPEHVDHQLAKQQFAGKQAGGTTGVIGFGTVVTFQLRGGIESARRFIASAPEIPFCPSLGEVGTTLSHPASTSHRNLSSEAQAKLGISGGTIRLSVGTESSEHILAVLGKGLKG